MYQMPPQYFANMNMDKVESTTIVEVFKLEEDAEQERGPVKEPLSTEDSQLGIGLMRVMLGRSILTKL